VDEVSNQAAAPAGDGPVRTPEVVLREPSELVSPRAVGYWRLSAVPSVVLALVVGTAAVGASGAAWWSWVLAVVLLAASIAVLVVMPGLRYRVHRWEVTHEAVYTRSGWLRRDVRIVPLSRVQTISTSQTAVMRAFGLASLLVTTASSAGAVRVEGLEAELAREVVGALTRDTAATEGDAT
jgi:membrane protein YdbS with pleckstrin-like domain